MRYTSTIKILAVTLATLTAVGCLPEKEKQKQRIKSAKALPKDEDRRREEEADAIAEGWRRQEEEEKIKIPIEIPDNTIQHLKNAKTLLDEMSIDEVNQAAYLLKPFSINSEVTSSTIEEAKRQVKEGLDSWIAHIQDIQKHGEITKGAIVELQEKFLKHFKQEAKNLEGRPRKLGEELINFVESITEERYSLG